MEDLQIKQLNKAYKKSFKQLNKSFFKDNKAGLTIFVEYLRYLRDYYVVTASEPLNNNTKLTTLMTAIAEFDATKITAENSQKEFHWNNFCEFVKLNMEEWLAKNDPI